MNGRRTAAAAGMVDIGGDLTANRIDQGGSARHVGADTRLSEYLVAAELRFPLLPSAVSP